jgi:FtsH-binding integral membrane protein
MDHAVRNTGSLFSKVALLLTVALSITALGTFLGAGITSGWTIVTLIVLFFAGAFVVPFAADRSPTLGIIAYGGWSLVCGLFLGPCINLYVLQLGWQLVALAFIGTCGVMAVCGIIGALSGRDFSNMGTWLMIALLALIVVGVVNIFMAFSHLVGMMYAGVGMVVFALFFIFDFFRLSESENTWFDAIMLTMNIHLDFVNFFLYALRFLAEAYAASE